MLNQVAVEALYSATYVENYLDSVENLPDDVQRHLSRIREIDVQYRGYLRDVDLYYEQWTHSHSSEIETSNAYKRAMGRMQQSLIAAQELGDEKLQIVQLLQDLIDHKTRQLDQDFKNLDYGRDEKIIEVQPKEIRQQTPPVASPTNANVAQPIFSPVSSSNNNAQVVNSSVNSTNNNVTNNNTSAVTNSSYAGSTANAVISTTNSERTSKRARRTRTETSGNGANTPISAVVAPMDVDPIDTSHNKVEVQQTTKQSASQSNSSAQGKKGAGAGKKKKRKAGRQGNQAAREAREDTPPPEEAIDPDEPTYCLCDQISFGEMILCDNDLCPIEWFHFSCVALMSKPKGKWFCPNCRGERPNVMKPKAQFLKELERYNKEKEEKT